MSPTISRHYYSLLAEPIIINYPFNPLHKTLFQFVCHHCSSAYPNSVHFTSPPPASDPTTVHFTLLPTAYYITVHFTSPPIIKPYYSLLSYPIIIDYPVTPHQQTLVQFIYRHRSSAYPISVHFPSPPISRPYYSSFYVAPHQHTILQFVSRPYYYWLSCHPPSEDPISGSFPSPFISIAYFSAFHVSPPSSDPTTVHFTFPPTADPITAHFMSPPISRPYYSSLADPIIIDYPVTPHQQTIFQFISRHRSSA